jgi:hypothetical protein
VVQLKWQSNCLARVRLSVQTPAQPKKNKISTAGEVEVGRKEREQLAKYGP